MCALVHGPGGRVPMGNLHGSEGSSVAHWLRTQGGCQDLGIAAVGATGAVLGVALW